MPIEIRELIIKVTVGESVSGMVYTAAKKGRLCITLILGHGAGADQSSPFMRLFASGLAERGIDVLTFNFLYMEKRKHVPDKAPILESTYQAVIEAAHRHKKLKGNRIAIGGKSMGGRIASQVAASLECGSSQPGLSECGGLTPLSKAQDETLAKTKQKSDKTPAKDKASIDIAALVFLGYPLHPPGRPDKLRDAHLKDIRSPMLFIQGSRDAFGTAEEISAVIKRLKLPATLHAIEGGDHSLKVPKSAGVPQPKVYETTMNAIVAWLKSD